MDEENYNGNNHHKFEQSQTFFFNIKQILFIRQQ